MLRARQSHGPVCLYLCATLATVKYELETESYLIHTIDEIEWPARARHTALGDVRWQRVLLRPISRDHCLVPFHFVGSPIHMRVCKSREEAVAKQQHHYNISESTSFAATLIALYLFIRTIHALKMCNTRTIDNNNRKKNQLNRLSVISGLRWARSLLQQKYILAQSCTRDGNTWERRALKTKHTHTYMRQGSLCASHTRASYWPPGAIVGKRVGTQTCTHGLGNAESTKTLARQRSELRHTHNSYCECAEWVSGTMYATPDALAYTDFCIYIPFSLLIWCYTDDETFEQKV